MAPHSAGGWRRWFPFIGACLAASTLLAPAYGDLIYQNTSTSNGFAQLISNKQIGNEITLAGTARDLSTVTLTFANTDTSSFTATYTLNWFLNDGTVVNSPNDPATGQVRPNTLVASASTTVTAPSGASGTALYNVSFNFAGVTLPSTTNTFTVAVSSNLSANVVYGPGSTSTGPTTGSALNFLWTNSSNGQGTWSGLNNTGSNFLTMSVTTTPAPSGLVLAGIGGTGLLAAGWWRGRRARTVPAAA